MKMLNHQLRPPRRLVGAMLLAMTLAVAGLSTAAPAFADAGRDAAWAHAGRDAAWVHRGGWGHDIRFGRDLTYRFVLSDDHKYLKDLYIGKEGKGLYRLDLSKYAGYKNGLLPLYHLDRFGYPGFAYRIENDDLRRIDGLFGTYLAPRFLGGLNLHGFVGPMGGMRVAVDGLPGEVELQHE